MWRSRLLLLLLLLAGAAAPARARLCLPPATDGGARLIPRLDASFHWLELLLRQHELCWRRPARDGELRVFLSGNSSVYGFPLPVEEALQAHLDRRFADASPPARFFNLGYLFTYQLKDALILEAAAAYEPDLIVHGIALTDFRHVAPMPFGLEPFFDANAPAVAAFARERPAGLEAPAEIYRDYQAGIPAYTTRFRQLREIGRFLRAAAHENALWLRRSGLLPPAYEPPDRSRDEALRFMKRQPRYDCAEVTATATSQFRDWRTWNILAYLEQLAGRTGARVMVVNWPVAHEPVGACYNVRYTARQVRAFNRWLEAEAQARGFDYVDLHDLLPARAFFDSLHPIAKGQTQIARRLTPPLRAALRELAAADGRR